MTILPKIIAPNDSPTFPATFNPNNANCLLSRRLIVSKAKEDMVVKEPQKPIAKSSEYFVSRFQNIDKTEKTPRMKLPTTLISRMLTGSVPNTIVDETNLYLRKAPANAPTPNKINSSPFIFQINYQIQFY